MEMVPGKLYRVKFDHVMVIVDHYDPKNDWFEVKEGEVLLFIGQAQSTNGTWQSRRDFSKVYNHENRFLAPNGKVVVSNEWVMEESPEELIEPVDIKNAFRNRKAV